MPVTVGVNFMSVVHASSNGVTIAFPDVCKTGILYNGHAGLGLNVPDVTVIPN